MKAYLVNVTEIVRYMNFLTSFLTSVISTFILMLLKMSKMVPIKWNVRIILLATVNNQFASKTKVSHYNHLKEPKKFKVLWPVFYKTKHLMLNLWCKVCCLGSIMAIKDPIEVSVIFTVKTKVNAAVLIFMFRAWCSIFSIHLVGWHPHTCRAYWFVNQYVS